MTRYKPIVNRNVFLYVYIYYVFIYFGIASSICCSSRIFAATTLVFRVFITFYATLVPKIPYYRYD